MSQPGGDGGELESAAGEYVIGTLSAGEREAFAARLASDADARQAVVAWEQRLAHLADLVDSVAPAPETWSRIEQALQLPGGKPLPFRVIEGGGGVLAASYLASRNRWRTAALAIGAVAAALVIFVATQNAGIWPTREPHGTFVAAINRGGDKPALIVRVDLATRQVLVSPVSAETPKGRSLELWYVADGNAPRSMGLIKNAPATIPLPADLKANGAATFAVSVEPIGGSTTGGPTGPVVYSGALIEE